jgi:hypothetical protein
VTSSASQRGSSYAVEQRLALAPERHEPLLAHPREVLRQRRLRQVDRLGELADAHLAALGQFAQHHQARTAGERPQHVGHFAGTRREDSQIGGNGGHRFEPLHT